MEALLRPFGFALTALLVAGVARGQATECVTFGGNSVSGGSLASNSVLSPNGRYVLFMSDAWNLVPYDFNGYWDVFLYDRFSTSIQRVNLNYNGQETFGSCQLASISDDGRIACFSSAAVNMIPNDTNSSEDVFVRDVLSGRVERVSVGPNGIQANSHSVQPAMTPDARYVAFMSWATNLVGSDTNNCKDIFVRDRVLATIERISIDSSGVQADRDCWMPSISADGRFVAFESTATNLVPGDTNLAWDVFVHDRFLGTTERVSVDSAGNQANDRSRYPVISADGRFVAFHSFATNLVPLDHNGDQDVFVHDRLLGTTEIVSVDSTGVQGNHLSKNPDLSADGRFVAFESISTNLVPGDTNSVVDLFIRDRWLGTTERFNLDSLGAEANDQSFFPRLSPDGRLVTFSSAATNLVSGDANGWADVFVRDRGAPVFNVFCVGDGSAGSCPCSNSGGQARGCENSAGTGGARLIPGGLPSLANDTLVLRSAGEPPHALSVVLQGTAATTGVHFGDGLNCTGGTLSRLYVRNAVAGSVTVPQPGDPSISARSAALGDPLTPGARRYYQVYYRDSVLGFCPAPQGSSWNVSSGVWFDWQQ